MKNIIFILLFILISGCSDEDPDIHYQDDDKSYYNHSDILYTQDGRPMLLINCKHQALVTASAMESYGIKYEVVRGDVILSNNTVEGHVQTRALLNGTWYWLELNGINQITFYEEWPREWKIFEIWEEDIPESRYTARSLLAAIQKWDDMRLKAD